MRRIRVHKNGRVIKPKQPLSLDDSVVRSDDLSRTPHPAHPVFPVTHVELDFNLRTREHVFILKGTNPGFRQESTIDGRVMIVRDRLRDEYYTITEVRIREAEWQDFWRRRNHPIVNEDSICALIEQHSGHRIDAAPGAFYVAGLLNAPR